MTHLLANAILVTLGLFSLVSIPPIQRKLGRRAVVAKSRSFAACVVALWVFSIHETSAEHGWLYAVVFSCIPLIAGTAVHYRMARRRYQHQPELNPRD